MKSFKRIALCFLAAGAMLGGAGCSQQQAPAAAPITADEVQSDNKADMQFALTGYFQTHKLTKDDIHPGLTIIFQSQSNPRIDGTMTATGKISPKGCPVWHTVSHLHWHDDDGTRSTPADIAICP